MRIALNINIIILNVFCSQSNSIKFELQILSNPFCPMPMIAGI